MTIPTVRVYVPTYLRDTTDGNASLTVQASTLAGLLTALAATHPQLADRLSCTSGRLPRHVSVFVNDQAVDCDDAASLQLNDGDEIAMIPALAGGCLC